RQPEEVLQDASHFNGLLSLRDPGSPKRQPGPPRSDVAAFVEGHPELIGTISIAGIDAPLSLTKEKLTAVVHKYLLAVQEAGRIYRHIGKAKGEDGMIAEVSMDETDAPQT